MKPQLTSLPSRTTCHHLYPSGRRCRYPVMADSMFCAKHVDSGFGSLPDVDLSHHFGSVPLNFRSASEINDFLCTLARLMIENRVSARRASVLAYIASLELRTLPEIEKELDPGDEFPRIVFDSPEPIEMELKPNVEESTARNTGATVGT